MSYDLVNIGQFLARSARYWPQRAAVLYRDRTLTFRELDQRSSRLANALLGLGLARGDRVAAISWNRPELVELECALFKAGLVKVILNARLSDDEMRDCLLNSAPAIFFVGPEHLERVRHLDGIPAQRLVAFGARQPDCLDYEELLRLASSQNPDIQLDPRELAVLHYSSGSTGKQKAAMQTVGNRMTSVRKVVMGRMRCEPGEVLALAGPVSHASGMFMQPWLAQGGTLLLLDRFEPDSLLAAIARHRACGTFLVPTMISAILADGALKRHDHASLRFVNYGAAPMAPARIREAWEAFGPVLAQGYGAGETTGGLVFLNTHDHRLGIEGGREELLLSCGRAIGESRVELLDDDGHIVPAGAIGEICVRGPDVFAGYWREPELSRAAVVDGWLHTGDLARMDEEGYIFIVDRKKDMIVSGGFNVYPAEVEQALYQHPAVQDACVVGVPDDHWGEVVKAVVTLRDGATASAADLIEHCGARLAGFKKPRSVDFVDALPKNANGKLSRKELKARYWQGRERMVN